MVLVSPPAQTNMGKEGKPKLESHGPSSPLLRGGEVPAGAAVDRPSGSRAGSSQTPTAPLSARSSDADGSQVEGVTKTKSPKPVFPPPKSPKVVSEKVPGPSMSYSSALKHNVPRPPPPGPDVSAPAEEDTVFFSIMRARCLTTDLSSFTMSRLVAIELVRVLGRADMTNVSDMSNGALLIKTNSDVHRRALSAMTSAGGVPVTVSPHPSMNRSRGVIYAPKSVGSPPQMILNGFQESGECVVAVSRLGAGSGVGLNSSPLLLLTFDAVHPPSAVCYNWMNFDVRPFERFPRQCYRCYKFGHVRQKCRGKPTCANCAGPYHPECSVPARCINCGAAHRATSRSCPMLAVEKRAITRVDLTILRLAVQLWLS
jgi:hypothetical protein